MSTVSLPTGTKHRNFTAIECNPLGFTYSAGLSLFYLKTKDGVAWKWLASTGRMALTNYIGQSVIGMFLFYGIGLGFGTEVGLLQTCKQLIPSLKYIAKKMSEYYHVFRSV